LHNVNYFNVKKLTSIFNSTKWDKIFF
jgi:hypothetical protein